jgi:hypothetical protein
MSSKSTRNVILSFIAAVCLLSCAAGALGTDQLITSKGSEPTLRSFVSKFYLMSVLPSNGEEPEQLVIADSYGYVNLLKTGEKGFKRVWKSFHLGGKAKGLHIHDLGQDGNLQLVVHTLDRLYVFDARTHELLWESVESDFTDIRSIALGQFDGSDKQHEFLILAGDVLVIYDGVGYTREWEGVQQFSAFEMVVGNVDGDDEDEVVLNSGYVFGALSHTVKWQTEDFGSPLGLIDIDGDGILEVIGEAADGQLNVFDVDKRQEKQNL